MTSVPENSALWTSGEYALTFSTISLWPALSMMRFSVFMEESVPRWRTWMTWDLLRESERFPMRDSSVISCGRILMRFRAGRSRPEGLGFSLALMFFRLLWGGMDWGQWWERISWLWRATRRCSMRIWSRFGRPLITVIDVGMLRRFWSLTRGSIRSIKGSSRRLLTMMGIVICKETFL